MTAAQTLDLTFLEDLLWVFNTMFGNLGNMNEAFNIAFETGECAKLRQAGNDALHQLTDTVFFNAGFPWVVLQSTN